VTIWRLRTGADRRIRSGHPWIFSNELQQSPKGHPPGSPVVLLDAGGKFLASGYGNPHSLIAFRALSFSSSDQEITTDFLQTKILRSWQQRHWMGYKNSFRMVYGEGDYLPGLVIDRYVLKDRTAQVLAVQVLTAGLEFLLKNPAKFFELLVQESQEKGLSEFSWEKTAIVLRNDVNIRRLEGLEVMDPQIIKEVAGIDLKQSEILVDEVLPDLESQPIVMSCDLFEGQKTGFFLDQVFNIQVVAQKLMNSQFPDRKIRILDLCCYVGHWSTQLTRALKKKGFEVETTLVDVSAPALEFAKKNADREGAVTICQKLDVLEDLGVLPTRHYDVVIADPPAFIKAKKDVPTGRHAYLKLNAAAFKHVLRGGYVVSCSCSGLFVEEEMMETLRKSIQRTEVEARCIAHGGHAADHPNLMSFPEGFYLKMFLHQVI
jgi:23S rRNA (cytosine1962-C5)-methyltransferase